MRNKRRKHKNQHDQEWVREEKPSLLDKLTDSKISFVLLPVFILFLLLNGYFKDSFTKRQIGLIFIFLYFLPMGLGITARMYVNENNKIWPALLLVVFLVFTVFFLAFNYGHFVSWILEFLQPKFYSWRTGLVYLNSTGTVLKSVMPFREEYCRSIFLSWITIFESFLSSSTSIVS